MNMPGFTGEASLYRSGAHYNMAATGFLATKAEIRPALSPECNWIRSHLAEQWRDFERAIKERDWNGVDIYAVNIRFYTNQFAECR
jgi:hypothetical protein